MSYGIQVFIYSRIFFSVVDKILSSFWLGIFRSGNFVLSIIQFINREILEQFEQDEDYYWRGMSGFREGKRQGIVFRQVGLLGIVCCVYQSSFSSCCFCWYFQDFGGLRFLFLLGFLFELFVFGVDIVLQGVGISLVI